MTNTEIIANALKANDGVTDQHYEKGQYYKLFPPPPCLPFPVFDVTDAENPEKALHDPLEADGTPEVE